MHQLGKEDTIYNSLHWIYSAIPIRTEDFYRGACQMEIHSFGSNQSIDSQLESFSGFHHEVMPSSMNVGEHCGKSMFCYDFPETKFRCYQEIVIIFPASAFSLRFFRRRRILVIYISCSEYAAYVCSILLYLFRKVVVCHIPIYLPSMRHHLMPGSR